MVRVLLSVVILGVLGLWAPAQAGAERPRVGLVLGGGGARGAAHIGVLEVLERLRIRIDCIAGTSMGALVAGAYAAGVSPAVMRSELGSADWADLFQDNPKHSETSARTKFLRQRLLPGAELRITDNGLDTLPGVVAGQKIKLFFNQLVGADRGERLIEKLPMPLSIIATDIGTGERVVLRDGSLTMAMRASMSVPGLLDPVTYRGHKLVDGGLVDNVPIGEVRERCRPDIVIVVNVGSPLLDPADIGSLLDVSVQMVNILTEQNVTRSLATLRDTDIYLKPDLEGITAGDFQRSGETADRGRAAAQQMADRLSGLAVSDQAYAQWRSRMHTGGQGAPRIDAVEVAELKQVNPEVVERHLRTQPGDTLDTAGLNKDVLRMYGDGFYERVDYQVLTSRERNILRLTPVEKEFGTNSLRFGFNLDTTVGDDASFNIRAANYRTWLNSLGAELLIGAQIGSEPGLFAEFYQPLEPRQRLFVEPTFSYGRRTTGVYQNNVRIAEYKRDEMEFGLFAGLNIGVLGQARIGWVERDIDASIRTGVPSLPSGDFNSGGWAASLDFDQTNTQYFPTKGWRARLNYFDFSQQDYSKLTADLQGTWSATPDIILTARVAGATSPLGTLPAYDAAALGGFLNLSGFARRQIIGDQMNFASLRVEHILGRMPLGMRGDLRAGLSMETGEVDGRYTEQRLDGRLYSGSIYVGGETPLGPLYLGYGYAPEGSSNLVLFVGTP